MGLLDGFEKLINEHGSAAILRERIALANDQYAALEKKVAELDAESKKLQLDKAKLEEKCRTLEQNLSELSKNHNPSGHSCDHCASKNLKHIGNKPHPTFRTLGKKMAIYRCGDCQQESSYLLE